MNKDIEQKFNDIITQAANISGQDIRFNNLDPVMKMMIAALMFEADKIDDDINMLPQRIAERFCEQFMPMQSIGAIPALTIIRLCAKKVKESEISFVESNIAFTYKTDKEKQPLNYIPIFKTAVIPYKQTYLLTQDILLYQDNDISDDINTIAVSADSSSSVYFGISVSAEIEAIKGLSFLISGMNGIIPEHIYAGSDFREVNFASALKMEDIEMIEPFDAQQASGKYFSFIQHWKDYLLNLDNKTLLYITDETHDRDIFKPKAYPKVFQQWLEEEVLNIFKKNTLWFKFDFPKGTVIGNDIRIDINVLPVVNVDVNTLTLTTSSPIAKLQKQENSFFIGVLENSVQVNNQGFGKLEDEILIKDFDSHCYNNGDLYRDVRNLYNKFTDNYYAFTHYNDIRDGETLNRLREILNKLDKATQGENSMYKFDSGTYAMKNMKKSSSSVKVSYLTTQGAIGNSPHRDEFMENRRLPLLDSKAEIMVSAMCGTDKPTPDARYEQLRYYTLTNDRLYTKMDIDAFLRKELITIFGKEEFKRIFIKMSVEGTAGEKSLQRGLYIDLEFKDTKNYDKAIQLSLDKLMQQKIINLSCISMPIIVNLKNLEE